jgi:hypothetical protein
MKAMGVLEAVARGELEAVLDAAAQGYRPGGLEALSAADPAWRAALDRAEQEAGLVLAQLRAADRALLHWRATLAEVARLWQRLEDAPVPEDEAPVLERVA